jgi:hypothetical protein
MSMRLAEFLKLFERQSKLAENFEEKRRPNLTTTVDRDGNRTAVRMIPPLVAACLTSGEESEEASNSLKTRAVALGINYLSRVGGKFETFFIILCSDHVEHVCQFRFSIP